MATENKHMAKGLMAALASFIFLSVLSFIFDCFINLSHALENPKYIFAYLLYYLLMRSWLVLALFVLYYLFTRRIKSITGRLTIALLITAVAAISGKFIGKDDWNLSIHTHEWKNIPVYALAALLTWLFYEWLMRKNANGYIRRQVRNI